MDNNIIGKVSICGNNYYLIKLPKDTRMRSTTAIVVKRDELPGTDYFYCKGSSIIRSMSKVFKQAGASELPTIRGYGRNINKDPILMTHWTCIRQMAQKWNVMENIRGVIDQDKNRQIFARALKTAGTDSAIATVDQFLDICVNYEKINSGLIVCRWMGTRYE